MFQHYQHILFEFRFGLKIKSSTLHAPIDLSIDFTRNVQTFLIHRMQFDINPFTKFNYNLSVKYTALYT
jgi:hypothetical protein